MTNFTLHLPIWAGFIEVSQVTVSDDRAAYAKLLECGKRYADPFGGGPISDVPGIQVARRLFRILGIEPTKHRPASEAMLRRFLKGKEVYAVNNVVDVSNWCALDFLLPNGIYDRAKIVGDIELRKVLPGESYLGLNNLDVNLENRYALTDRHGPFGSPKTDSQRSCIDYRTKNITAVVYAPLNYDRDLLQKQCDQYADRIVEFCSGKIEICQILTHTN